MADVHSREVRSYNMSQIKGKDTTPELIVRKFLHKNGFRFSLHSKDLPGKPDIVLSRRKTIVDVRGCFWHGHKNCKYGDQITSQSEVITERVRSAILRDSSNEKNWKELGYKVIIVWDSCELEARKKKSENRDRVLANLLQKLREV
ncbi:MAG: very short patch repair endonuclease [Bacteroidota bacterium]